ncbi:hypothetical protein POL68_26220 [Stigmatella sp. ncwal1]|uniref:Uncharacterized protein n=1 Tax=Stigmatella ashevillensis TaxID=2995309 RepID=A0ABT5DI02_9BACT|nr:hypothetical protein [Stigmatella ashevillena]MDC0711991.1 hypothetical protein [Stigmatella ashevillena]
MSMTRSDNSLRVSAGYLVARPVDRTAFMDASLLPPVIRTASGCLAQIAPDTWALAWVRCDEAERCEAASRFGIPPGRLAELMDWVTQRFDEDFLWPNLFQTLEGAREFCATFVPEDSDACILGLALSSEDADVLLRQTEPTPGEGELGLRRCLALHLPPREGGLSLGSEVLGLEVGGTLHSSLCNGLARVFAQKLSAQPNAHGLFDDHALAQRCAAYAGREEVGAEPVPWRAWVLTEYPPFAAL